MNWPETYITFTCLDSTTVCVMGRNWLDDRRTVVVLLDFCFVYNGLAGAACISCIIMRAGLMHVHARSLLTPLNAWWYSRRLYIGICL